MTLEHKFFHFDALKRLTPGQVLTPDADGLSLFGRHYVELEKRSTVGRWPPALAREKWLERVRESEYSHRSSRYATFFAAQSLEEAKKHLERVRRGSLGFPSRDLPIYEVFSQAAQVVDVMWLDIAGLNHEAMIDRYRKYWAGETANDRPYGLIREPLMEVMLPLPVRIGQRVA